MEGIGKNLKLEPNLDNQIKFVEFMIEGNSHEIIKAIKESLLELKAIKEKNQNI